MNKRKIIILLLAIAMSISFASCKKDEPVKEPENSVDDVAHPNEIEPELVVEEIEEPEEMEPEGSPSPLSGIYADESLVNGRVMSVVFDNHPKAKWQAGLKDAEVIYEFPVEGPYTRYIALYLLKKPDSVGPIRSARPYLVTIAHQFDAIFVHVGGSEQAKADVRNLNMAEIDGLTSPSSVFWRKSHKRAPNNMYSSMNVLRDIQNTKGFRDSSNLEGFNFHFDDKERHGVPAVSISVTYNRENSTEYKYDENLERYKRYKEGRRHIDESDQSGIYADNIIIQENPIKVLDNEGRLGIDMQGSGKGIFITKGVTEEITWEKQNRKSKIFYYGEDGSQLLTT